MATSRKSSPNSSATRGKSSLAFFRQHGGVFFVGRPPSDCNFWIAVLPWRRGGALRTVGNDGSGVLRSKGLGCGDGSVCDVTPPLAGSVFRLRSVDGSFAAEWPFLGARCFVVLGVTSTSGNAHLSAPLLAGGAPPTGTQVQPCSTLTTGSRGCIARTRTDRNTTKMGMAPRADVCAMICAGICSG